MTMEHTQRHTHTRHTLTAYVYNLILSSNMMIMIYINFIEGSDIKNKIKKKNKALFPFSVDARE